MNLTRHRCGYDCCRRAILLAGTKALQRFSISGPDLRIDAAKRSKQGQSVHRFSISSPDLRINAAKRSKQGQSLQPKGVEHCAAAGERRMGRLGRGNHQHQTQKKSPDSSLNRDSRSAAATYSPTWCSSTIGASELNFSVRDGKRWILTAITAAI